MRKKLAKGTRCILSLLLAMAVLSGCGKEGAMQGDGGLVQNQDPENGGQVQDQSTGENGAGNALASKDASGAAGEGTTASSGQQPDGSGKGDVYFVDDLYTREENILPVTQPASAGGISCKIENVEYTESFGDRNRERLNLFSPEIEIDSQGKLSEGFQFLFLTITFTNTTEQSQEIVRTSNAIYVVGDSLITIPWTADACYYDRDWEKGTESEKHHWELEPGEGVTSEIGWVIESSARLLEADPTLEDRMGYAGPYPLYYRVGEYDGSNENSFFIDLGVKAE